MFLFILAERTCARLGTVAMSKKKEEEHRPLSKKNRQSTIFLVEELDSMGLAPFFETVCADVFSILDKNRGGALELGEMEAASKKLHAMMPPKCRFYFKDLDANSDGSISIDEWLVAMKKIVDENNDCDEVKLLQTWKQIYGPRLIRGAATPFPGIVAVRKLMLSGEYKGDAGALKMLSDSVVLIKHAVNNLDKHEFTDLFAKDKLEDAKDLLTAVAFIMDPDFDGRYTRDYAEYVKNFAQFEVIRMDLDPTTLSDETVEKVLAIDLAGKEHLGPAAANLVQWVQGVIKDTIE